ncbi:hypothetical protein BJ508DRAFT_304272 [Ascobolus immersus RN42]|uniref:Uncharacterized protein n=1 Tax=Ascobolus immersus RN42 TaxID=1160509 RepID=A0A3N4IHE8_ASCIM|nr:hypothetical protein BJ508DRAFT_304272 [Ascobolus immersus RN42]
MRFTDLPHEIRLLVADHLLQWPDHKAFRQCDSVNYTLLSNRLSVRKQFGLVEQPVFQRAIDSYMLSFFSGSGLFYSLRTGASSETLLSRPSDFCTLESKESEMWLSFVHQNDCLEHIRRMFSQEADFYNVPDRDAIRTLFASMEQYRKIISTKHFQYIRKYHRKPECYQLMRDTGRRHTFFSDPASDDADLNRKFSGYGCMLRGAAYRFILQDRYSLVIALTELEWDGEHHAAAMLRVQLRARELLADLDAMHDFWVNIKKKSS